MIRIYIFTYAGDAQEAAACIRCARMALPEAVVTVADDSAAPVPDMARKEFIAYGARYRRTDFPRCGNLNGPECVRGIVSTLAGEAADDDIVVKIDSDTALLSGRWIESMPGDGLDYCFCGGRPREVYGLCYAMSGRLARRAEEVLRKEDLEEGCPEDITINRTIMKRCRPERFRVFEPWTPLNRQGRFAWWNWDSITVNPENYAQIYDVVSVGNLRPPHIPQSARWEVMHALCDAATGRKEGIS